MPRILLQLLACALLCPFNLWGAFLIYYESRLFKKAGLFLLFMGLTLVVQHLQELALPALPNYLMFSMGAFISSAFTSLLVAAHRLIFHQVHRYQMAANPKSWQTVMNAGNFFFARLFPAFLSIAQVMAIFR